MDPVVREILEAMAGRYGSEPAARILAGEAQAHRRYQRYTEEQLNFLREKYRTMTVTELRSAFHARFGIDLPEHTFKSILSNNKITSGRSGRFEKGSRPWNTGVKGYMGANATSFKRGNLPHNHRPLYHERVSRDGYIEISVPETNPHTGFPTRFKMKHVWIWEQEHGPVPEGKVVVFRDGNKQNCALENLLLISRAELLSLNLHKYSEAPDELKPAILSLAKVEAAAGFRTSPARGRKKRSERSQKSDLSKR